VVGENEEGMSLFGWVRLLGGPLDVQVVIFVVRTGDVHRFFYGFDTIFDPGGSKIA
jgi:hypothetical protein